MATVQGPSVPPHDIRKVTNRPKPFQVMPPPQPPNHTKAPDPYYGNEQIAKMCARFVSHLFACPEYPPSAAQPPTKLAHFIAYALHRTKLHKSVTYAALVLLQRLKARFPTARGSSGHRLFISAFMIASKVICDDTYSNKSWTIVAQGLFTLREINQMEREMCGYLEWELTVDNPILSNFQAMVDHDFMSPPPYPTYSLQQVSRRAIKAAASSTATPIPEPYTTTSPIPPFRPQQPGYKGPEVSIPSRRDSHPDSPMTPDTPSFGHTNSNATSPATTASPQTPVGQEDFTTRIQSFDSPKYTVGRPLVTSHKSKSIFAYANPVNW